MSSGEEECEEEKNEKSPICLSRLKLLATSVFENEAADIERKKGGPTRKTNETTTCA